MCGLFGLLDCSNELNTEEKNQILRVLAKESEARGTDAAGIAYNRSNTKENHISIYKRPKAGKNLHISIGEYTKAVIGHTRMTTQGDAKYNYNNHPFKGKTKNKQYFALAHNGVLYNDDILRITEDLPQSKIETDSYVAVQLLEQQEELNFAAIKTVAEQLEGTFVLTILDGANNVYIVRGENPLCLMYYPQKNVYLYTSTDEIMKKVLKQLNLNLGDALKIEVKEGEILKIDDKGKRSKESFVLIPWYNPYSYGGCYGYGNYYNGFTYCGTDSFGKTKSGKKDSKDSKDNKDSKNNKEDNRREEEYINDLKSVAGYYGFFPEEIDELLRMGYSGEEIEEFLYMDVGAFSYA